MYKKLKTLIGIIVLGAIGSGFWEMFLKDFLFYLGNSFIKYTSLFYAGYADSIYERVGKGSVIFQTMPSILISILFIFSPFLFSIVMYFSFKKIDLKRNPKSESEIESSKYYTFLRFLITKRYRLYLFIFLLSLPGSVMWTDLSLKEFSTYSACRTVERDIDIIRPYLSEKEYIILISNYRQIDNRIKLIAILNKLNELKLKNNIKIEENRLLAIDLK